MLVLNVNINFVEETLIMSFTENEIFWVKDEEI